MVNRPDITIGDDGVLRSGQFDDIYYSTQSGLGETDHVFLNGNDLHRRWKNNKSGRFTIGETGFGSGLNFLATWQLFDQTVGAGQHLHYISVEKYPLTTDQLSDSLDHWRGSINPCKIDRLIDCYPPRLPGFHTIEITDAITLTLIIDDAVIGLSGLTDYMVDAWFLDGFTPSKNPSMWCDDLYHELALLSHPKTTLSSFTAAGHVRRGLQSAGFDIEKRPGFGKKREMITGRFSGDVRYHKPTPPDHVLVTGAGLAGSAAAWQLAQCGIHVTVIDLADDIAHGASGNPIALINPKLTAKPTVTSDFYTAGFSHALAECQNHDDIDFIQSGSLHIQKSADKKRRFDGYLNNLNWPETAMQKIPADHAADMANWPIDHAALFYPHAAMVNPKKLIAARLSHPNITIELGAELTGLSQRGKKWDVMVNDRPWQTFSHVVVCHGWQIRQLAQADWLPLRTSRGQITMANATEHTKHLSMPLSYGGYITPPLDDEKNNNQKTDDKQMDGVHMLGATYTGGTHTHPTDDDHDENIARLHNVFARTADQLSGQIIGGRASIRTTVKDRFPIIGQLADASIWPDINGYYPGLYVLSGLGSHGVIGSSIGGRLIGHLISTNPPPVPKRIIDHLNPARFLHRRF